MNRGVPSQTGNTGTDTDFISISLQSISVDSVLDFDLYQERTGGMRLFRHKRFPISREDINGLKESGNLSLYVPASQRKEVLDYTVKMLPQMLADNTTTAESKLKVLTEASVGILDSVLSNPRSTTGVKKTVKNCRNHVTLAMQGGDAQKAMVDSRPVAPPPIAHAIHVCNLSILLGMRCQVQDPDDVHALAVGALLHEIGKRLVDKDYYFNNNEYHRVTNLRLKKYPLIGSEMLATVDGVPHQSIRFVAEHQEILDGSGFPKELKSSDICLESRVVAICDHYDEMLNCGKSLTPFHILKKMKESGRKFDQHILVEFIRLLGSGLVLDCR